MPTVLVVGATRGLGLELAKQLVQANHKTLLPKINWIDGIDVAKESAGEKLAISLDGKNLDTVILALGHLGFETFDKLDFEKELLVYKTSAIGPVFIVQNLHKAGLLPKGSKVIIIDSESGSIALWHESEGRGNYGHYASKTATNMVGKLLSLDLKEHSGS